MSILNVAHMCSHLQNACQARLAITSIKNTKYNLRTVLALHRAGLISAVARCTSQTPPTLEEMMAEPPVPMTTNNVAAQRLWIGLKYYNGQPVMRNIQALSRPKVWITANINELTRLSKGVPTSLQRGLVPGLNLGEVMILGTSEGVLELREALKYRVGGTLICRAS